MKRDQITDHVLGLGLLFLVLIGCYVVLRPFLTAILWAAVLTFSTWPLFLWMKSVSRGRIVLSASIMTFVVAIVLVAPFVIVAAGLAENALVLIDASQRLLGEGLPDPPGWLVSIPVVGDSALAYWRGLAHDSAALIEEGRRFLPIARSALLAAGEALGSGLLQLALSVFLAFFFYCRGETVGAQLQQVGLRLAGERAQRLIDVAGATVISVVYGILGTALAQGLLAGIGFLIAGVPAAPLLGLATFFLSILPAGPPLVWIPATIWLFWQGEIGWGIFLALWGFFVISGVDNIIKPWLISHGSHLPFAMVLLGVLGGALAFGFIGVFLGPTLLAVGYRLLLEWSDTQTIAEPPH